MTLKHRAIQLTVKENPVAFDYYGWNDSVLVASPGSMAFYRISDNGTPSHVFYYDQAPHLRSIRIQQLESPLIATVHDQSVTIWDPAHVVSPMVHTLSAVSGVTDCQWSTEDSNLFSLTTTSGMISIWDVRTLQRPTKQLMMGKATQKMQWCSADPNMLAVSTENRYVLLWDLRNLPSSSKIGGVEPADSYMVLEPENGVSDFTWAADAAPRNNQDDSCCPFIWAVSDNAIELHHISRCYGGFDSTLEISHTPSSTLSNARVLAQSAGQGLMLLHDEANDFGLSTKLTYVDVKQHQSVESEVTIATTNTRILGADWRHVRHGSYSATDLFHRSFIAFSSTGVLHIVDWTKRKHSNSWDVSKSKGAGQQPPQQHLDSLVLTNPHIVASQTPRNRKLALKRIQSVLAMDTNGKEELDMMHVGSSGNLPVRTVVGPKTFLLLIKNDLEALDLAIRHGAVEGIRVASIDHFSRQLVLEILIPTADNGTINNFNMGFHNHFRKEELAGFYLNSAPGKTVQATISFPIKTSHFWITPKLCLENKSRCAVSWLLFTFNINC
jgi:hypothetical protein